MPIYTYDCTNEKCLTSAEAVTSFALRDELVECAKCAAPMQRAACEVFAVGKPAYQMKAIMTDGSRAKGHFGVSAPNKFLNKA
jgi:predicted nucleic acid-binding Zn ribbon protein